MTGWGAASDRFTAGLTQTQGASETTTLGVDPVARDGIDQKTGRRARRAALTQNLAGLRHAAPCAVHRIDDAHQTVLERGAERLFSDDSRRTMPDDGKRIRAPVMCICAGCLRKCADRTCFCAADTHRAEGASRSETGDLGRECSDRWGDHPRRINPRMSGRSADEAAARDVVVTSVGCDALARLASAMDRTTEWHITMKVEQCRLALR